MNTELIIKACKQLETLRKDLRVLEAEAPKFELRVFTGDSWYQLNYKPENGAIRNMVIHQVRMELQNKIITCKREIKMLVGKSKIL